MSNITKSPRLSERGLLDYLSSAKLTSDEFVNNEKAVDVLCDIPNKLKDKQKAILLATFTQDKDTKLLIINKSTDWPERPFVVYSWKIKEQINKAFSVDIHKVYDYDISDLLGKENEQVNIELALGLCVVQDMDGYSISKKKLKLIKNIGERSTEEVSKDTKDLIDMRETIKNTITTISKETQDQITTFCQEEAGNLEGLSISIQLQNNFNVTIGKITNVYEIINKRIYTIKASVPASNTISVTTLISDVTDAPKKETTEDGNILEFRTSNDSTSWQIPYNYIDIGRYILSIREDSDYWGTGTISQDPKIDSKYDENFKVCIAKQLKKRIEESVDITETEFNNGKDIILRASSYIKDNSLRGKLQGLKNMIEEAQYISGTTTQQNSGVIQITDNITYDSKEGKIQYGNFSIAFKDEGVKNSIYKQFRNWSLEYFRNDITEQQILDTISEQFFAAIRERINWQSTELKEEIIFNNKVKITLELKKSTNGARYFYLNDQRFNKNEIITIIKELSCCQEQETADMFINNVGRLGLSVYIGISSGYETNIAVGTDRLFKFKKLKGRSNYSLLLDKFEIPIKGKKLISLLYKKFQGEYCYEPFKKIQDLIYDSVVSPKDYLKYKFLIDELYTNFITRSEEFLAKKIKDTESEMVKYYDKKLGTSSGIKVKGSSGNTYVIAYDKKNSFVFMTPEEKDGVYYNGKYICMIDQSTIKSNIGYDTVISKLMALKNDSFIAHTIYNLEEEIGSETSEEEEDD